MFSLHVIGFSSFWFLWFNSSFMLLWSEKMLEIISVLWNLLRFVLCPSMWSVLENVPCTLEKNVYSAFCGCSVLKISIKSNCPILSFSISVALLMFCLKLLSIDVNGVLYFPNIIVILQISPFMSVSIFLMYLDVLVLDTYTLTSVRSSPCIDHFIII